MSRVRARGQTQSVLDLPASKGQRISRIPRYWREALRSTRRTLRETSNGRECCAGDATLIVRRQDAADWATPAQRSGEPAVGSRSRSRTLLCPRRRPASLLYGTWLAHGPVGWVGGRNRTLRSGPAPQAPIVPDAGAPARTHGVPKQDSPSAR